MSFSSHDLQQCLTQQPPPQRWVVAYSGGLDSTVLLHTLVQLGLATPICAVHINHQLSLQSDQWQQHCADNCARLEVEFVAEKVTVIDAGEGIEAAARRARYAVFEQFLQPGDCLLQGHHLDDQAETLLLRLLRGSGPRGLAGIQAARSLGQGHLYRPLLGHSRDQLCAYAKAQGLQWIDDDSNLDTRFDRNYLRHKVLPLLSQRWPTYKQRFQQAAALCGTTDQLSGDVAAADLAVLQPRVERLGVSIDLSLLQSWSQPRRHNVLRHWFEVTGVSMPAQAHLQEVERQLIAAESPSMAEVSWGEAVLRCYNKRLFCLRLPPVTRVAAALEWGLKAPLQLPDTGSLSAAIATEGASRLRLVDRVYIRWRSGGERCQPHNRQRSQTLKKLLQEHRLEPWLRDRVPLIYIGSALAAVGDLWVCKDYTATAGEPGIKLAWYFDEPGLGV